MRRPLDRIGSIKVKLGVLVVAATSLGLVGGVSGVVAGLRVRYALVLSVVVALVVVQLLARGMTRPLREMVVAAQRMARGDHTVRVTATSRDEVGELARAFNSMAADLAEVDAQRRRLVADVSHELRTPLSALQVLLENLADGVTPPDPATFETALAQVTRLSRLVSELLDLSRLEAGEVPLDRRKLPLQPLLEQAVREVGVTGRPVEVVTRVDPADLQAHVDPARLQQVLANLLDNATRHSPVGGRVDLVATSTATGVRIEVRDEGPGVPPQDRERVFARFARTDDARARSVGGSGLGLAITRWIVELHGGTVAFADPLPPATTGCRVVVDLPRSSP